MSFRELFQKQALLFVIYLAFKGEKVKTFLFDLHFSEINLSLSMEAFKNSALGLQTAYTLEDCSIQVSYF